MDLKITRCPNCKQIYKQQSDSRYPYRVTHLDDTCPFRFDAVSSNDVSINRFIASFLKKKGFRL